MKDIENIKYDKFISKEGNSSEEGKEAGHE